MPTAGAGTGGGGGGAAAHGEQITEPDQDAYSHAVTNYITFDSPHGLLDEVKLLQPGQVLWARPVRWNNPGFDFVCIWRTRADGVLNMVAANATCAQTHDVRLDTINQLATFFSRNVCPVGRIRFDFLVPAEASLQVTDVTGRLCDWANLRGSQWMNMPTGYLYLASSCIVVADVDMTKG